MSLDNDTLSLIRGFAEPLPPIVPGLRINTPRVTHERVIPQSERHCQNCSLHDRCWMNWGLIIPASWELRNEWAMQDQLPYFKGIFAGICGNFMNVHPRIGISVEAGQREWEA